MAGKPKLAGVVGWPIEHSLSPLIHTLWAAKAGIDGYYVPLAIPPNYDHFARAMDSLIKLGFEGVNVTLPHKVHALQYAQSANDKAVKAGVANMLTFSATGAVANNSDIEGFVGAVKPHFADATKTGRALILGAGGAARGVAIALKEGGFLDICIANRTREKAEALALEFGLVVIDWKARNDLLPNTDLLVNTTSLGMTGQPPLDINAKNLRPQTVVADIVYAPLETTLLQSARRNGCKTVDGLSMLMYQAAPGFRAWFGGAAKVDERLRKALVNELARRSEV